MGCTDQAMKLLPIIDFSDLKQETPKWESVKSQVREALEEYGCFEAKFEDQNIPLHLRKSLFDGLQQLFDLPVENKQRNRSDNELHGYIHYPTIPLYESMGIYDPLSPGKIETFTNQMWSQGNPTFSKSVQSFSDQLSEVDKIVRTMVVESLGLSKYMNEHLGSTKALLRVQKYDVPETQEIKVGLVSHKDKSILTILYQNEVNGLQLLKKDGGRWITIHPSSPNSFIVMAGEPFHVWTNGRVHSPYHRVMMSGDEIRYSMALFSNPRSGHVIETPEETVNEEHPLLFKPLDYDEYVKFSRTVAGRAPNSLKAYCGL